MYDMQQFYNVRVTNTQIAVASWGFAPAPSATIYSLPPDHELIWWKEGSQHHYSIPSQNKYTPAENPCLLCCSSWVQISIYAIDSNRTVEGYITFNNGFVLEKIKISELV